MAFKLRHLVSEETGGSKEILAVVVKLTDGARVIMMFLLRVLDV